MKIYITSGGFVGNYLKEKFKKHLTDEIEKADIIINTIGILKEDKHTYEDSHINIVKNLIPKVKNKKFIHISALGSQLNHPSRYKHTKAVAENLIKENLQNYAIIKPSIILGSGQKLYEDLKKFKNMPLIFAPKMKIQPIQIEKLGDLIEDIIKKDLTGEFKLCGDKIISMKELFKEVFKTYGKDPITLEMPKAFFGFMLPILNIAGILSKDEYLMIEDNICEEKK